MRGQEMGEGGSGRHRANNFCLQMREVCGLERRVLSLCDYDYDVQMWHVFSVFSLPTYVS